MRRLFLRTFRHGHVERWRALRQGECPNCPHDIVDPRDLKFIRNVCGYWFRSEDDCYASRERFGFAQYGFAELIGFTILLLSVAAVFGWLTTAVHWIFAVPLVIDLGLWLFVVSFFRDPPRAIPADADALISPADGTVSHVETIDDPDFPGGTALRISIFLSVFNVHVNRIPRSGRVSQVRYFRGEFLDARHADCHVRNEQLWIDFEDAATSQPLRVKQISGAIARRIVCKLRAGDEVRAGDRFGMIKFGSRTDVLVPPTMVKQLLVQVGDKVRGASTVLMRVHSK